MESNKPVAIYILGGPGSGKGTQSKAILDSFPGKFYHISTGSLLRDAVKQVTPENAAIIELMKQGQMVPSQYLVGLVKEKMKEIGNKTIYILDGFPRNSQNLEVWKQVMKDDVDVRFLLYFECPQDEMRKRLLERAKTSGRPDDTPETIEKRILFFNEETKKMFQTYKQHEGRIIAVNANQTPDKVTEAVKEVLFNQKIVS